MIFICTCSIAHGSDNTPRADWISKEEEEEEPVFDERAKREGWQNQLIEYPIGIRAFSSLVLGLLRSTEVFLLQYAIVLLIVFLRELTVAIRYCQRSVLDA